jgi:CBS domain-containing protein
MARTVGEVMTTEVVEVSPEQTLVEVARLMRDNGVGAVLVTDGGILRGIVTDRDIVVRAVAEGLDPQRETVDTVFSGQDLVTVTPDTTMGEAVELMRRNAVRRLPVVDDTGRPAGIVSIGDLAIEGDGEYALADISAAPPNE